MGITEKSYSFLIIQRFVDTVQTNNEYKLGERKCRKAKKEEFIDGMFEVLSKVFLLLR